MDTPSLAHSQVPNATLGIWPRARARASNISGQTVLTVLVAVVIAGAVLPPFVFVVLQSLREATFVPSSLTDPLTLVNYVDVVQSSNGFRVLFNTLVFAAGSATLNVSLTAIMAWLAERTDAGVRAMAYATAYAAFAIPSIIFVFGWNLVLNPSNGALTTALGDLFGRDRPVDLHLLSMPGMIFLQGVGLYPLTFFVLAPAMSRTDAAVEEAGAICGAGSLRTLVKLTLPILRPALLTAWLLAFLVSIDSYEVPALNGVPAGVDVLSTTMVNTLRGVTPNLGRASAYGIVLVVLTLLVMLVYMHVTREQHKYVSVAGRAYGSRLHSLGRGRPLGKLAGIAICSLTLLPLVTLLWTSFFPRYVAPSSDAFGQMSLNNYRSVLDDDSLVDSAMRSLKLALVVSIVVIVVSYLASYVIVRGTGRMTGTLNLLATLPIVIPGLVLSLGVSGTYIRTPLYDTVWILALAYFINAIPLGVRFGTTSVVQLSRDLEDAAHISGAGLPRTMIRVVVPLLGRTMVTTTAYVFLGVLKWLSVVLLLVGPNTGVVVFDLLRIWQIGDTSVVAAFSMLWLLVVGTLFGAGALVYLAVKRVRITRSRRYAERIAQ